jgi:hypothetical protein
MSPPSRRPGGAPLARQRERRVVRFRVAAAFLPAAIRFGDFRVAVFLAVVFFRPVVRLRVAAAFLPAAIRFGDFRVAVFLAVVFRVAGRVVALVRAVACLRSATFSLAVATRSAVSSRFAATAGSAIGPVAGIPPAPSVSR